jgi:hypothetical protein
LSKQLPTILEGKKDDDFCSTCKASWWKGMQPESVLIKKQRRKASPCEVLRYFPIKDRLKRLFMCKDIAPFIRWHDEERIKDGALRHPADAPVLTKIMKSFQFLHQTLIISVLGWLQMGLIHLGC